MVFAQLNQLKGCTLVVVAALCPNYVALCRSFGKTLIQLVTETGYKCLDGLLGGEIFNIARTLVEREVNESAAFISARLGASMWPSHKLCVLLRLKDSFSRLCLVGVC
jgi:hypothetical protein